MCEVVNLKTLQGKTDDDVYIGRPSIWGNPYSHKTGTLAKFKVKSLKEALDKYERHLLASPALMSKLHELKGKRLVCWCKPGPCHGDVLKKYVDRLEKNIEPTLF